MQDWTFKGVVRDRMRTRGLILCALKAMGKVPLVALNQASGEYSF